MLELAQDKGEEVSRPSRYTISLRDYIICRNWGERGQFLLKKRLSQSVAYSFRLP